MQTQQLICRNCKHFRPNAEYYAKELRLKQGFCTHPQSQKVDIITGIPTYEKAVDMRGEKAACGPVATLFEPETNSLDGCAKNQVWSTLLQIGWFSV